MVVFHYYQRDYQVYFVCVPNMCIPFRAASLAHGFAVPILIVFWNGKGQAKYQL